MTNTFQLYPELPWGNDIKLLLVSVLLISTLVYADQNTQLDLTLDFDDAYIEDTMDRDDWREPETQQDNNWRQPQPVKQDKNYRFGARSIYEENPDQEPIMPGVNRPTTPLGKREAAPDFRLRF